MSNKSILVLIVFMSLGTYDLVQAETIRGVEIPDLNVTRALGKWYAILGPAENDRLLCATGTVEQPSENNVKLIVNVTEIPGALIGYPPQVKRTIVPMSCAMVKDSNILTCNNSRAFSVVAVVFDIDYDSYMAVYVVKKLEHIASGTYGHIYILSRQLKLPDGIIEKVKQSNIFKQSSYPQSNYEVMSSTIGCRL